MYFDIKNVIFVQSISWKISILKWIKKEKFIAYVYFAVHIFERHVTCNLQCNRRSTACVREIWLENIHYAFLFKDILMNGETIWFAIYILLTLWFCISDLCHGYFTELRKWIKAVLTYLLYTSILLPCNIWNISM